jgi:acyl-CoA reductase-like NAD-dependent aldehyde dehydrogenase
LTLTAEDRGDEAEAIAIANDCRYGLGGAVFAADVEHGLEVAAKIINGTCSVNGVCRQVAGRSAGASSRASGASVRSRAGELSGNEVGGAARRLRAEG